MSTNLNNKSSPRAGESPFWQLKKLDNKPQWSDWYWGDNGIFRHRYSDWRVEEECSDCVYLKQHLEQLRRLKQELIDRADEAKGTRKREFERVIKSKEEQIDYVSQRLQLLQEIKGNDRSRDNSRRSIN